MIELEFWHVDVFSRQPFLGNGLVVVLDAEGLSPELMQAVTREMRQFETVFLTDVDLDGRAATLGSSPRTRSLSSPAIRCSAQRRCCTDGCRRERVASGGPSDSASEPSMFEPISEPIGSMSRWIKASQSSVGRSGVLQAATLRAALGLTVDQLHPSLPMQVVSTGLDYLIVPVAGGLEQARVSTPDLEALLHEIGAKFVYVLDPQRPEGRTWDNAGRVEDVATGSAAGPAAGYLIRHGVHPGDRPILVHQGRFTGRPSTMRVRPEPDGRLWVGGPVASVAAGRFQAETE